MKEKKFNTKHKVGDTVYCIKDVKEDISQGEGIMYTVYFSKGDKYKITKIEHFAMGGLEYTTYSTFYFVDNKGFFSPESFRIDESSSGASGMSGYGQFEEHFSKNKEDVPIGWDEYFLGIAEQVKLKSKDQSSKLGAVIVGKDNDVLSVGYNSFPRGFDDDSPKYQERPEKYDWFEHAERNAIYSAARRGVALKGSKIYLSSQVACMPCARAIINSGIKKVYCKREHTTNNKEKWDDSCAKSLILLKKCGVKVIYYDI